MVCNVRYKKLEHGVQLNGRSMERNVGKDRLSSRWGLQDWTGLDLICIELALAECSLLDSVLVLVLVFVFVFVLKELPKPFCYITSNRPCAYSTSTAPVQHQYSTSTAPVQHQYRLQASRLC
ncbi:unnamed protein product [[Candida] boidinii]|uniref:Unnamed protein product n=1 Tax=Candida boidinii TaxID=5477 RepID=A0ACB5TMP1_CANBO|nr:unnamed protein product [[Candida] boidinii]